MLKMIAAIIGINFLIDHPYIALGLVCAIGYLIYWGIQQKNNQDNAEAAPAPTLNETPPAQSQALPNNSEAETERLALVTMQNLNHLTD